MDSDNHFWIHTGNLDSELYPGAYIEDDEGRKWKFLPDVAGNDPVFTPIGLKWTRVEDSLPPTSGWYLVYAPTYSGGSSTAQPSHDGIMFSQFKIFKNGNCKWSIEVGYYSRPNCVKAWMPLPNKPQGC